MKKLFSNRKSPSGPNLDKNELVTLDLSGTKISLSLPLSNTRLPKSLEVNGASSTNKGRGNISIDIDQLEYKSEDKSRRFFGEELFSRSYIFNGLPILGGKLGGITVVINGVFDRNAEICSNFYELIYEKIDRLYSLDKEDPYFKWLYPIDWKLVNVNDTNFLYYSAQDLTAERRNAVRTMSSFTVPISNTYQIQVNANMQVAIDSNCLPLVTELIKNIVGSITISYSEKHLAEINDARLQEKFEPIKPYIWGNFKKVSGVDYSILDRHK